MAFGLRRAKVLGYLSVQLVSKISNVCDPDPPTLQTDRQTDGQADRQTTCDRNTALCTKVHRAVKTRWAWKFDKNPVICTYYTNTTATTRPTWRLDVLICRPAVGFFQTLTNTRLIFLITPATFWLNKCVSQYRASCSLRVVNSKEQTRLAYSINGFIW